MNKIQMIEELKQTPLGVNTSWKTRTKAEIQVLYNESQKLGLLNTGVQQ